MQSTYCFLWRVQRDDGYVVRATDHDKTLNFLGENYDPRIGINTTKIVQKLGLGVDNLEVSGGIDGEIILAEDIEKGLYDGAVVDIYVVNWNNLTEYYHKVHGTFGTVVQSELGYSTEIRSQSHFLTQDIGRAFQRTCDTKLGSPECGVNLTLPEFSKTATVISAQKDLIVLDDLSSYVDGWFDLGLLVTAAGQNIGIRKHVQNSIYLWGPLTASVPVNSVITVYAGCKQDAETCRTKFGNIQNFQGFPFMPGNDAIADYPVIGKGDYSGGSLFK